MNTGFVIADLKIDKEYVFDNVECRMLNEGEILCDSGSLVCKGFNSFQLRTKEAYYDLQIVDKQIRRAVAERIQRNYVILAQVMAKAGRSASSEEKKILILRLVAVLPGKNMGTMEISISEKVKIMLIDKGFARKDGFDDDISKLFLQDFCLEDGRSQIGCFTYFQSSPEEILEEQEESIHEQTKNNSRNMTKYQVEGEDKFADNQPGQLTQDVQVKDDAKTEVMEVFDYVPNKSEDGTDDNVEVADGTAQSIVEDIDGLREPTKKSNKGFKLFGRRFDLIVSFAGAEGKERLIARRVIFKQREQRGLQLAKGKIIFTNAAAIVDRILLNAMSASAEYVETWNKYAEMEGDFLLQRVRQIGILKTLPGQQYNRDSEGNLEVILDDASRQGMGELSTSDSLELVSNIPHYISDPDMGWKEYRSYFESCAASRFQKGKSDNYYCDDNVYNDNDMYDADKADSTADDRKSVNNPKKVYNTERPIKIIKIDKARSVLVLDMKQMEPGVFICSMRGNEAQIKRRESSRKNIMDGQVPNPRIAMIIAHNLSQGGLMDYGDQTGQEYIHRNALTANIKRKIFPENPPTSVQEDAIDLAINTPDIAIIQGPPGTGKTTVVTAILERLNELADKGNQRQGRVLITSLQHDAVENVIERIRINSLPTIKYGKRSSVTGKGEDLDVAVAVWCEDMAIKLRDKNPNLQISQEQELLADYYRSYVLNPTDDNAKIFLNLARTMSINKEVQKNIEEILQSFEKAENQSTDILPLIRRLRISQGAFADDGIQAAKKLHIALMEFLPTSDGNMTVLFEASRVQGEPSRELLQKLSQTKDTLLLRCIPRPVYKVPALRDDVVRLYALIKDSQQKPADAQEAILYDLLFELENNPEGIRNTVSAYSYAFAATAQQCEGKAIREAKGIEWFDKTTHPEYDTVIVDEAARVTPLDLMIPLSQAKERIILVGDHRQLPHMYDEEIFEAMKESGISVNEPDITISMFQNLKEKALFLEKTDGRKRFVTLDAQYRTHPLIGKFVSEQFYEPYGESFKSPLKPELFMQDLYPVPLVWLDMAYELGDEEKYGTSRKRMVEAREIARRIVIYMERDKEKIQRELKLYIAELQGNGSLTQNQIETEKKKKQRELERKQLTYGVITFYSAQVQAVKSELRHKLGSATVDELFKKQRLRVGSVDAFQGMEFDVIFLSVVRTGKYPIFMESVDGRFRKREYNSAKDSHLLQSKFPDTPKGRAMTEERDRLGTVNYGFLTSANRLCVAMSRQKKLLIVIGDSNVFADEKHSELAEFFVPSIKKLYELCQMEGKVEYVKGS